LSEASPVGGFDTPDAFGEFFLPSDLIGKSSALLQKWFPTYLQKLEERTGVKKGTLKVPDNYNSRTAIEGVPGESLPRVVVLVTGLTDAPTKDGRGIYRASYRMGVGVVVVAESELEAYTLSTLYGAAVKMIVLHHPGILGASDHTEWIDESFDVVPTASENQKFRGVAEWFSVGVNNVVQFARGPQDPAHIYGVAEKVKVKLQRDEI